MVRSSDITHNQSKTDVDTQCGQFFSLSFDVSHRNFDVYEDMDLVFTWRSLRIRIKLNED